MDQEDHGVTPTQTTFLIYAKIIGCDDCPWMDLPKRDWKGDEDLMVHNYALAVRNIVQDHPERWPIIRTPFLALTKEAPDMITEYRSAQRIARKKASPNATKWIARR